jgi:hypothetical protein
MDAYDIFVGLLVIAFYAGIPVLFGVGGYKMAGTRGRHQWGWGIACGITTFYGALLLAIIEGTPAIKQERANAAALYALATLNNRPPQA